MHTFIFCPGLSKTNVIFQVLKFPRKKKSGLPRRRGNPEKKRLKATAKGMDGHIKLTTSGFIQTLKHCFPGLAKNESQGFPGLKNAFSRPVNSPVGSVRGKASEI